MSLLLLAGRTAIKKKFIRCLLKYSLYLIKINECLLFTMGAQWLSGRVLDSRPRGRGFEPQRRQIRCVLEQDTLIQT